MEKYEGLMIMALMRKDTSPQTILFLYNNEDPFLVHFVRYRTKTREILDEAMLILPDVDKRIENYNNHGFEIIEDQGVYAL